MSYGTTPITPGSGANVAHDDIGSGVLVQRVKPAVGAEGTAVDVSAANPMPVQVLGELVEAMEAMRMAINALVRTIGQTYPDAAGRQRVALETLASGLTLSTVSTVTTVATVTSQTNQVNVGGFSATEHIPALMDLGADCLRRNIIVS